MDENDGALAVVVLSVLFVLALSPGPRKMSSAAARRFQPFAGPKSPDCFLSWGYEDWGWITTETEIKTGFLDNLF